MAEDYFTELCSVCRSLNLRPDTFLQTGHRYPSTLRYDSTLLELSGTQDVDTVLKTIYAPGEKLEKYTTSNTDETNYRRRLDQKLPATPHRHRFDEEGVPEWTVPDKKAVLGSLKDVRLRAGGGCAFCSLVVYAHDSVDDRTRPASPSADTSNSKADEDVKCKISFHFREIEGNMSSDNPNAVGSGSTVHMSHHEDDHTLSKINKTARQHGYYEATISFGIDMSVDILPIISETSDLSWFGGRPTAPLINHDLINHWLTQCQTHHPTCSAKQKLDLHSLKKIRIIDVIRGCLTEIDIATTPFVALSYVWGAAPTLKVTRLNIQTLSQPGGLTNRANEIPNTTRDAIHFVKSMGMQYLWTDNLCILQDDTVEMLPHLRRMDLIYAAALFTIVAADGADVAAGLPGSCPERQREAKPSVSYKYTAALSFTLDPHPVTKVLLDCVWTQRLWTLQEAWMSTRLVIFTRDAVHLSCGSVLWSENKKCLSERVPPPWTQFDEPYYTFRAGIGAPPHSPSTNASASAPASVSSSPSLFSLEQWISFVDESSLRKLTYEEDILNATAGLMYQLELLYRTRAIYGMPEGVLDEALLWSPMAGGGITRRKARDGTVLYPSWSWMGWVGEVSWPGGDTHSNPDTHCNTHTDIHTHNQTQDYDSGQDEGSVEIMKQSTLSGPSVPLIPCETELDLSRDTTEVYPYLSLKTSSLSLHVDKKSVVPDQIKELQPFAWFVDRGEHDTHARNVHCGWKTAVHSISELGESVAVGSMVFDHRSVVPAENVFGCQALRVRSEGRWLDEGEYAGQVFYEVLVVRSVRGLGDGRMLVERIGHGRVLVRETKGLWKRVDVILQ